MGKRESPLILRMNGSTAEEKEAKSQTAPLQNQIPKGAEPNSKAWPTRPQEPRQPHASCDAAHPEGTFGPRLDGLPRSMRHVPARDVHLTVEAARLGAQSFIFDPRTRSARTQWC